MKVEPATDLVAELRALRADNARLERRIDGLERDRAVGRAASVAGASDAAAAAAATPARGDEVPQLKVVKLKPKKEPAAKLDTQIQVQEPAEDALDALKASVEADAQARESDDAIDQAYDKAMTALKTGNVMGGAESLMRLAAEAPRHPRADNALYFAGLGLLGLGNVEDGARLFQQAADQYPAGDVVQDALLKLGECRLRLNKPDEARAVYERVVSDFPGSAAASQAQARLTRFSATRVASPIP